MSKISNLLTDFTAVSNLGNLPVLGRPNVNYLPKQDNPEGSTCYNNGKKGKMKRVDGRLTCVTTEKESDMDKELNEALKDMNEARGLRFQCASRSQIGKQYHHSVDYAVATAGLGKLKASPIQGTPGNWFFTLTANEENQLIDPSKMNGKLYSGVTVTAIARESQQKTAFVDKPKSVTETVKRMVEETKKEMVVS
jgi:hypothetical protein